MNWNGSPLFKEKLNRYMRYNFRYYVLCTTVLLEPGAQLYWNRNVMKQRFYWINYLMEYSAGLILNLFMMYGSSCHWENYRIASIVLSSEIRNDSLHVISLIYHKTLKSKTLQCPKHVPSLFPSPHVSSCLSIYSPASIHHNFLHC